MKKLTVVLFLLVSVAGMGWAAARAAVRPQIQLAILLDTSGSMDGLIGQAKSRLWKIVNELATAKKDGQVPQLQVALYEYGQDSLSAAGGYLRCIVPLTMDLDRLSEELFKLQTNGGQEYCGQVIGEAVSHLQWSRNPNDLKLIFIAGNEPFTQGAVDYRISCRQAIGHGIIVNTVFCGNYEEGLRTDWKAGADLADGQYLAIDANHTPPPVTAPQDAEIARLSREMNQTYVAYGREGASGKQRQQEQDKNAASLSGEVAAERAAAKAAPQYSNSTWDLVDAKKNGKVKLEEMKDEELPQEMKGMSVKDRLEYVAAMQGKREALQKKIAGLHAEREHFVAEKMKSQASTNTLDSAIISVLHRQAAAKNFIIKK
ncbi:MAG: VWA domain-containing protein [Candidatus Aminicenantes bacterium]|nr:VWA domain-containing protein [Candidatus Aminicenantes bacterium]